MPTLRPQRLSGLVVTPTVGFDTGLPRVTVAVDVGMSRIGSPPPEVVTREDLVVELRNPAEGSFEPVASPEPGPLPVRALRVVQASGAFTFGQGVDPPTEVTVALRGDRKTFPLSQTLVPTNCLKREPKEGGSFGTAPGSGGGILGFFPFFREGCCVKRFEAPLNLITDLAVKNAQFEMEADFTTRARRCRCSCCEYRQFVRGTFTDAGGAGVPFIMPSGPLDSVRYCEDGAIDEFGPGKHGYYGHRNTSSTGDEYSAKGCSYKGSETPSCPPTDGAHLEFLGLVVDRCRGKVTAKREWVVDL